MLTVGFGAHGETWWLATSQKTLAAAHGMAPGRCVKSHVLFFAATAPHHRPPALGHGIAARIALGAEPPGSSWRAES